MNQPSDHLHHLHHHLSHHHDHHHHHHDHRAVWFTDEERRHLSYWQLLSPTNSSQLNISLLLTLRTRLYFRGFTRLANPDSGFWDCRNSLPSANHLSGSLGKIFEQKRISGFPDILSKEKSLEVWSITERWDLETAITSSCTEKLDFESYLSWEHSTLDTEFPLDGHHQTPRQNFHYHWIRKSSASE